MVGLGKLGCQDGDEYDIIDAQNDLQQGERHEADPAFRRGEPFHSYTLRGLGRSFNAIPMGKGRRLLEQIANGHPDDTHGALVFDAFGSLIDFL